MTSPSYAARARLPAAWGVAAVEHRLASVRHRWNQFGLKAHVEVVADAGGIAVGYRLTVAGRPDADEVHAAFRADLDSVLAALSLPEPALGELEAMARAQADEPATPTVHWTWDADHAV